MLKGRRGEDSRLREPKLREGKLGTSFVCHFESRRRDSIKNFSKRETPCDLNFRMCNRRFVVSELASALGIRLRRADLA